MKKTAIEIIRDDLSNYLSNDLLNLIPKKWKKIGDVIIIKINHRLKEFEKKIGKVYLDTLGGKTILKDAGGITGEYRKPQVKYLFGEKDTVTIHKENGVRFKLDPQKVMFSSGNMDERIRMSHVLNDRETIVDLFAGIGYFSVPIAVHSRPKKIYACEKNPVSYQFLCDNIILNHVTSIIDPLKGDNREVAPKKIADRVIMGYIGKSEEFLETGLKCLKKRGGIIHFHEKYPHKKVPEIPNEKFEKILCKYEKKYSVFDYHVVKSYAPGISHFVFDIKVDDR